MKCSRLTFWAVNRFENKCRDMTIGWLIFIDFRILTLSVSVRIPLSALKAIYSQASHKVKAVKKPIQGELTYFWCHDYLLNLQ